MAEVVERTSLLTDHDVYLFKEGSHAHLFNKLGAHLVKGKGKGKTGVHFAVWAPNAQAVSLIGDFNDWQSGRHKLDPRHDGSGIWEVFVPDASQGMRYKFHVESRHHGYRADKGDPFAFHWETPPNTASVVWDLNYDWADSKWLRDRHKVSALDQAMAIYEVHLGSWMRADDNRYLSYRELATRLGDYVADMGYTHVEFLPIMEHPFYGSWGYQTTGYFAPTARFGTPQDFMFLIDTLHQRGIGVILDWVPSHFPSDLHGLAYFDGTHLYEHSDPRRGFHPEWNSYIFNYGRHEVRSFLLSSAIFWLEQYHIDGLRVDAVASMLYLDYARRAGEWIPNIYGGREDLEAIQFLKKFNETVYAQFPDVHTIAEESTAWPLVSRPLEVGGLGFGMKWNMGWMHDTLDYFSEAPVHRKWHHNNLTFSIWYAFSENFVLPLSHDEIVYGKGALLRKMPGDDWQRFANLRSLFAYLYAHPGKKLLFMGGEFGQWAEWYHEQSLDWHLLDLAPHQGVQRLVKDLNRLYREEAALHEQDFSPHGFEWIDWRDSEQSVISFLRKGKAAQDIILAVFNFTPVPRHNYRLGVPQGGLWQEIFNSDAKDYGGSGQGNMGTVDASPLPFHTHPGSLTLTLPPLSAVFFKPKR